MRAAVRHHYGLDDKQWVSVVDGAGSWPRSSNTLGNESSGQSSASAVDDVVYDMEEDNVIRVAVINRQTKYRRIDNVVDAVRKHSKLHPRHSVYKPQDRPDSNVNLTLTKLNVPAGQRIVFRVARLERLRFADQARFVGNADIVLAPHGAGLAWVVGMRRGSVVVEFNSEFGQYRSYAHPTRAKNGVTGPLNSHVDSNGDSFFGSMCKALRLRHLLVPVLGADVLDSKAQVMRLSEEVLKQAMAAAFELLGQRGP